MIDYFAESFWFEENFNLRSSIIRILSATLKLEYDFLNLRSNLFCSGRPWYPMIDFICFSFDLFIKNNLKMTREIVKQIRH